MPVFFQHQEDDLQLVLWNQQEPESFFSDRLPADHLSILPTHPAKRVQFLAGRFLLSYLKPGFPFDRLRVMETGRPYLTDDPLQFSISHAGSMIAAVVHPNKPVGIDVEKISERVGRVRRKFLDPSEEELILKLMGEEQALTCLTLAWSIKEAAFKALHDSGVDFIRDLPIDRLYKQGEIWIVKLGGKGSGLVLHSVALDSVCLSWATK